MTLELFLMFALVALLVGFSKGGLGGPVPVSLTAPLLSTMMPVQQAVILVLPLLIFADLFALYFYWRKWDMARIRLLLPAAVVGVLLGSLMLAVLPGVVLRRLVGAFTLIAVLYKLVSARLRGFTYTPRPWHGLLAGWASGFASSLANAGAPPFTAYMLLQPNMNPISFIGTTTLFFAIVNALKIPGNLAVGVDWSLMANIVWVLPLVPLGVWVGRFILMRMNARLFEAIMVIGLFLMSLWLLLG